jgi:adenosine deaminase
MSLESFIRAMPKVELHVHLEGAIQRDTLLMIAEQNNIAATMKPRQYRDWLALLEKPEYHRLDEIAHTLAGWLLYPEDWTRVVYDLGLSLARQNVRYAEVCISPAIYTDNGTSFETFLEAINDGRDRVERAWKVRLNWILTIPRDRPRKSDDIARWTMSAAARKGNVIGLGLSGREDAEPVNQFTKAFTAVEKKGLGRICHAHTFSHTEPLADIVHTLNPQRISDSWGIAEDTATLSLLVEKQLPLVVSPMREVCLGRIPDVSAYPLRPLFDGAPLVLASGMPELYRTQLNDAYLAAANKHGLDVTEIERLALNSVRYSFLPEDDKQAMLDSFANEFQKLREEHLANA